MDLNREQGTTLVIVTHDVELAQQTNRIVNLKNGRIESIQPAPIPGRGVRA